MHAWYLEHHILHYFFNNGTQSSGTCISCNSLSGNGSDGSIFKFQFHSVHSQQGLLLTDQRVLRFRKYTDQRVFVQLIQCDYYRQAANEFRNQSEMQ